MSSVTIQLSFPDTIRTEECTEKCLISRKFLTKEAVEIREFFSKFFDRDIALLLMKECKSSKGREYETSAVSPCYVYNERLLKITWIRDANQSSSLRSNCILRALYDQDKIFLVAAKGRSDGTNELCDEPKLFAK